MRRGALCVMGLWLLMMTGCRSSQPAAEPVGAFFSCHVEAVYRDITVVGTLKREAAGTLAITFSQPETLEGLSACWNGETVELSWHGLSFSMAPEAVPEGALGEEMMAVWDATVRGEGERTEQDGQTVICGESSSGSYELVCDAETGMPLSLSIPSLPLQAEFSQWEQQEEG